MNLPHNFQVNALVYTGKEPCVYWGNRGFGIRVYPSGKKKYVLSYRLSGRKRLLTIGEFPSLAPERAEDIAAAYRLQVADGTDPVVERRVTKLATTSLPLPQIVAKKTVNALCDAYVALHASKKRSGKSDTRMLERFVRPAWGKATAASVTRTQVAMLHAEVSKKTPGQANRLLAVLKTMWKKASMWGYVPEAHANPAVGVQMNKEYPRERFVKPSELPRLVAAIEKESDIRIRAALWLFLLTGARKSELLQAKWECVDLDRGELHIPRPKQGKPHIYPLSSHALQILESLPRFDANPFVIPGDKPRQHLVNISKAWDRVRERADLQDITLHDLRRSVGSWLAISGHSLLEIGKVLGHSSPRTTQIYARLTDDVARTALAGHAVRMMQVLAEATRAEESGSSHLTSVQPAPS